MYMGDVLLGATVYAEFTTVDGVGVPTSLLGTPAVAAYVNDSDTEITAGITLSVDKDARTGRNLVTAVLSAGNGFAAATDVKFVITAGTVGGASVVGYVVAHVSIQNRSIAVEADGHAHADLKEWLGSAPNALIAGRLDANMQALADGVLTAAKFAAGAFDAVWTVTTRTLSSFGTLVADVATAVWASASRTLTAFGFTVTTTSAAEVTAIKAKTDNLPVDPADQSLIIAATDAIVGRLPAALVGGRIASDVGSIGGDADTLTRLKRVTDSEVLGTCDAGSSVTSIVTSSLDPAPTVADQFKGRIVLFDRNTTTAALRGQGTRITASSAGGVLTVEALSTAPAAGDTFAIV